MLVQAIARGECGLAAHLGTANEHLNGALSKTAGHGVVHRGAQRLDIGANWKLLVTTFLAEFSRLSADVRTLPGGHVAALAGDVRIGSTHRPYRALYLYPNAFLYDFGRDLAVARVEPVAVATTEVEITIIRRVDKDLARSTRRSGIATVETLLRTIGLGAVEEIELAQMRASDGADDDLADLDGDTADHEAAAHFAQRWKQDLCGQASDCPAAAGLADAPSRGEQG